MEKERNIISFERTKADSRFEVIFSKSEIEIIDKIIEEEKCENNKINFSDSFIKKSDCPHHIISDILTKLNYADKTKVMMEPILSSFLNEDPVVIETSSNDKDYCEYNFNPYYHRSYELSKSRVIQEDLMIQQKKNNHYQLIFAALTFIFIMISTLSQVYRIFCA